MDKGKNTEKLPPKMKKLLDEIDARKARKNSFIEYSPTGKKSKGDVLGNTSNCNDVSCGGGVGNVSACDDDQCSDPGADPNTMGNTSSCGDWQCP